MKKKFIILAVCALVMAFALPAMGQAPGKGKRTPGQVKAPFYDNGEVTFSMGGDIFYKTFWSDADYRKMLTPVGWVDRGSDSDLVWERSEQPSRLNASFGFKDFTSFVEINSMDDDVKIRQAWGEYNFGKGYFAFGKMFAPTFKGNEVAIRDYGTPGMYGNAGGSEKEDMLRLRFPFSNGEVQIAGVRPRYTMTEGIVPPGSRDADDDFTLPILEASLAYNFGKISTHLSGGYLSYDEVVQVMPPAGTGTEEEYSRSAHFLQLAASARLNRFTFQGKIWNAENPQQYGLNSGTNAPIPVAPQRLNAKYDAATGSIADVDAYGYVLTAKYQIRPGKMALVLGYAAEHAERDDPGGLSQERDSSDVYLQLRTRVTKNVMIIPVIGVRQVEGKTEMVVPGPPGTPIYSFDGDLEDTLYAGVMWRFHF